MNTMDNVVERLNIMELARLASREIIITWKVKYSDACIRR